MLNESNLEDGFEIQQARVLIVDDNPARLMALTAALDGMEIDIVTATSGTEALHHLLEKDFAAVLLDVNMPIMDGFETAVMIRSRPRSEHLPILFITAERLTDDARLKGYELGAVDYIFSPVLPQILRAKVAVFADIYRLREKTARQSLLIANQNRILEEQVEERTARLQESEERFRKSFQYAAIGMALIGLDGSWLKVNNALCQIVGYSEHELLNKTFQEITHPDDLQTDIDFVAQLLDGKIDNYQFEKRYFHKDGHVVWIRLSVSLIKDAQDKPLHFVSQIDDITEEKLAKEKTLLMNEELEARVEERTRQLMAAQEELLRQEKLALLGQVADTVGHELRNPLGVMSNAVYFLQTVLTDADEITREYLGIIRDEIGEAERIVSDLLDAVRTKPPYPERVVLAELLEKTLKRCTVPASITVNLDIPASLPAISVDPMHLYQVLWNLIANALEAMPEGGELEITAQTDATENAVTISIRDTGGGIAPENIAKLFQPLFTTKARHIGLGLVVVKNLTQVNGGSVSVTSEPGKGSKFSVTLPGQSE